VQARRGRGHRAGHARVDRLVARPVVARPVVDQRLGGVAAVGRRGALARRFDVRRQRNLADLFEPRQQSTLARALETQQRAPLFTAFQQNRAHACREAQLDIRPAAQVLDQRLPQLGAVFALPLACNGLC